MSSIMAIEADNNIPIQSSNYCPNNMTWIENLLSGFHSLLIHPFLPFSKSDFSLKCLFSGDPYCCIVDYDKTNINAVNQLEEKSHHHQQPYQRLSSSEGYLNLIKHNLDSLLGFFNLSSMGRVKIEPDKQATSLSKTIDSYYNLYNYTKRNYPQILLISQLILCTIILGYYLLKDIKDLFKYIKSIRSRE